MIKLKTVSIDVTWNWDAAMEAETKVVPRADEEGVKGKK